MTNPNDPAFGHGDMDHCEGLTKREEFAKAAMEGLSRTANNLQGENLAILVSILAVRFADALIAQLNKPK